MEVDGFSWHDCHLWGVSFGVGDPDRDDWTSDLVLDIDYIVEWICGTMGSPARFRVAPASLVFHDVTDLSVDLEWSHTGGRSALSLPSLDAIVREPIQDPRVGPGRTYHRWEMRFNWPQDGSIRFGATGFTQMLRADPILTDRQHLLASERDRTPES